MDFTKKYRPARFGEIIGQRAAVSSLKKVGFSGEASSAYLFYGESGTGKTTTARVVSMVLNCEKLDEDGNPCGNCSSCKAIKGCVHQDVLEIDAADARGIDNIRELKKNLYFTPLFGKAKILILDEAHGLTKDAQNSLLKILEEAPSGVCIILCSTEPSKILKTVRNRCQSFEFKAVSNTALMSLLKRINKGEGLGVGEDILKKVAEASSGLPRNAVIKLQQISSSDMSEAVIEDILCYDFDVPVEVIKLCRVLNSKNPSVRWATVVEAYRGAKGVELERIRISVAGYLRAILEKSNSFAMCQKMSGALELLVDPLPQTGGDNKLVLSLYKVYVLLRENDKRR